MCANKHRDVSLLFAFSLTVLELNAYFTFMSELMLKTKVKMHYFLLLYYFSLVMF